MIQYQGLFTSPLVAGALLSSNVLTPPDMPPHQGVGPYPKPDHSLDALTIWVTDASLALPFVTTSAASSHGCHCFVYGAILASDTQATATSSLTTDAEKALAAYHSHGAEFPAHLSGRYDVALWDSRARRLVLATDHLGKGRLFWRQTSPSIIRFGSRCRPLADDQHTLDATYAMRYFLAYHSLGWPLGDETPYRDVKRLPPGHLLRWDEGHNARVYSYWDIDSLPPIPARDPREYGEGYRACFLDSLQCLANRTTRLCVSLSGGLDSGSILCGLARGIHLGSQHHIHALTNTCLGANSLDTEYRDLLKQALPDVEFEELNLGAWWYRDLDAVPRMDEPAGNLPCYSSMIAMGRAVQSVGGQVLLTGHGGDGLLSGSVLEISDYAKRMQLRRMLRALKSWSRGPGGSIWQLLRLFVWNEIKRDWPGQHEQRRRAALPPWIHPGLMRDCSRAMEEIFLTERPWFAVRLAARASIYQSSVTDNDDLWEDVYVNGPLGFTEMRPFDDRRLMEFMMRVPESAKHRFEKDGTWVNKLQLREGMRGIVPDKLCERIVKGKAGGQEMSVGQAREWPTIDALLFAPDTMAIELGLVNGDILAHYRDACRAGVHKYYRHLWRLVSLEVWLRQNASHERRLTLRPPSARVAGHR